MCVRDADAHQPNLRAPVLRPEQIYSNWTSHIIQVSQITRTVKLILIHRFNMVLIKVGIEIYGVELPEDTLGSC